MNSQNRLGPSRPFSTDTEQPDAPPSIAAQLHGGMPTPITDAPISDEVDPFLCAQSRSRQLERALYEANEQTEKMREAIREAHRLLVAVDAGAQPDVEGLNWYDHRSQTLPKLQPFLT